MPILGPETAVHPSNLLTELVVEENSPRRWWAVYTKARQEKAFARQLLSMDVPFYLPLVPKDNLVRGRPIGLRAFGSAVEQIDQGGYQHDGANHVHEKDETEQETHVRLEFQI